MTSLHLHQNLYASVFSNYSVVFPNVNVIICMKIYNTVEGALLLILVPYIMGEEITIQNSQSPQAEELPKSFGEWTLSLL